MRHGGKDFAALRPHQEGRMDLQQYLDASPSPAWAAENAAVILGQAGFAEISEISNDLPRKFFLRPHSGMVIAATLPEVKDSSPRGFRIVGAHTDSPHLRIKPNGAIEREGYTIIGSEVYGGALLYTWFDRDLAVAGEVFSKKSGIVESTLVKIEKPIAIVPSLAIHLQRGVNEEGFTPARNTALHALFSLTKEQQTFQKLVAQSAGVAENEMLSYDLSFYSLEKSSRVGNDGELLTSSRLDNLVSCHAALSALSAKATSAHMRVVILFDHEEVGSVSESGAESRLMESVLRRIASAVGLRDEAYEKLLGESCFLSADMAHGLHPNFADKHDAENRPLLGGGVTLKVNQNRRYASSARTQAIFHDICRSKKIPEQVYTHRNDLPCGSTIGPMVSARLGMPTLDVGIAMLGMHSIRETCATADLAAYETFMTAFLAGC
jgi:aspartyl aminopeptidase